MSKLAKDIKNQPKLKKALATYIAENTKVTADNMLDFLLEGHRGFLAMSEKELTNKFDAMYEGFHRRIAELESKIGEAQNSYTRSNIENEIKSSEAKIKEADALYDALFEQLFL